VAEPAVRADLLEAIDRLLALAAQVALDLEVAVDVLAELRDLFVGQVLDLLVRRADLQLRPQPAYSALNMQTGFRSGFLLTPRYRLSTIANQRYQVRQLVLTCLEPVSRSGLSLARNDCPFIGPPFRGQRSRPAASNFPRNRLFQPVRPFAPPLATASNPRERLQR